LSTARPAPAPARRFAIAPATCLELFTLLLLPLLLLLLPLLPLLLLLPPLLPLLLPLLPLLDLLLLSLLLFARPNDGKTLLLLFSFASFASFASIAFSSFAACFAASAAAAVACSAACCRTNSRCTAIAACRASICFAIRSSARSLSRFIVFLVHRVAQVNKCTEGYR
jgi:hypothetical protein